MTTAIEHEYGFSAAARILGLSESKLRYWSQSGFVGPSLRRAGRQVYSFQDLVSVRAAKELVDRGFQPAAIRKALEQVRTKLLWWVARSTSCAWPGTEVRWPWSRMA